MPTTDGPSDTPRPSRTVTTSPQLGGSAGSSWSGSSASSIVRSAPPRIPPPLTLVASFQPDSDGGGDGGGGDDGHGDTTHSAVTRRDISLHSVPKLYGPAYGRYEALYRMVHSFPELSGYESNIVVTASRHLQLYGFKPIWKKKSKTGWQFASDYMVAGTLDNGPGPTVMLRCRIDAQAVREDTNVWYASDKSCTAESQREPGKKVKVSLMHANGHDLDMICLMAAMETLAKAKQHWSGKLVVMFERGPKGRIGHVRLKRELEEDECLANLPGIDVILSQRGVPLPVGTVRVPHGTALFGRDDIAFEVDLDMGLDSNPQMRESPVDYLSRFRRHLKRRAGRLQEAVVDFSRLKETQGIEACQDDSTPVLSFVATIKYPRIDYLQEVYEELMECAAKPLMNLTVSDDGINMFISDSRDPMENARQHADAVRATLSSHFGSQKVSRDRLPKEIAECDDSLAILASLLGDPAYVVWFYGREKEDQFREAWEAAEAVVREHEAPKDGDENTAAVTEEAIFSQLAFKNRIPFNGSPKNLPSEAGAIQTGAEAMVLAALKVFGLGTEAIKDQID